MTPAQLRAIALAACPELAAAWGLVERVAALDPSDGGQLARFVGEARAIGNASPPRDSLRLSHGHLQEQLTFLMREYGADLGHRYPGVYRYTLEALENAHRINPTSGS